MQHPKPTPPFAGGDAADANEAARMRDAALTALDDAKGEQIVALDVRQLTDVTDFMIIATGTSERHIKTLADRVVLRMRDAGWRPHGMEGENDRDWVLVDFVDVVVHIMRAAAREHYDLEGLWNARLAGILSADGDAGAGTAAVDAAAATGE